MPGPIVRFSADPSGRRVTRPARGSALVPASIALAAAFVGGGAVCGAPAPAADDTAYLRYTHPTIARPFPDLLDLEVPAELENRRLAALGYLDVTAGPFRADPTGRVDATRALQAAADFARDHQMVCFFPAGTYRISDTLGCVQQLYRRSNGRVLGANRFPNLLMGSRLGPRRPRLLLAPESPGFADPAHPKAAVHIWARGYLNPTNAGRVGDGLPPETEQPNISMNQMLVNLDIEIAEGNPGAIALRHQGAEGSAVEDCTIDATHGLIGIQGGIGSGGSSAGVTVIGGRIGLDFTGYLNGTQPTPCITGFTLHGQTEAAIRSTSRQTLVAAGLTIVADACAGPLLHVPESTPANVGQLTLVDSQITFTGPALARPERVAVSSGSGVYLHNVFVQGATLVVSDLGQGRTLPGSPEGWLHIRQYAHAAAPRQNQDREYRYPVYVDGRSVGLVRDTEADRVPPADLQTRHLWASEFPGFESPGAVNAKEAPYLAKGDGLADDTAALQRAIAENDIVFLPKGCYRLTRTLDLKPHTKLVGAGQHLSILLAAAEGAFADPAAPAPLVRTADTADAGTVLAFCALWAPRDVPAAWALHWRSGGRSVFRAVEILRLPTFGFASPPKGRPEAGGPPADPPVRVTGHGGGNWYNYRAARIVVDGASGPLRFYQFSPQQVTNEIIAARDVSVFGTKYEGNQPMVMVRDRDRICLLGHGGNAKGLPGGSLFVIERTPNLLLANSVDGPTRIGTRSLSSPQGSTDPRDWHMIVERLADGREFRLPPLERPVLYQRGTIVTARPP